MRKLKIGKNTLVFGLTWYEIDTEQAIDDEVKRRARSYDSQYGVLLDGEYPCVGLTERRFDRQYSAAALFAKLQPNALIIEQLDSDRLWICMTINGSVVPSTDVFKGSGDIVEILQDYVEIIEKAGVQVSVFTDEYEQVISELCGGDTKYISFFQHSFIDLVKDSSLTNKERIGDLLYRHLSIKNLVRLCLFGVILYLVWQYYSDYSQSDLDNIVEFTPPEIIEKVSSQIERNNHDLAIKRINEELESFSAQARIDTFIVLANKEKYKQGWMLSKLRLAENKVYRELWKRVGIGSVNEFLKNEAGEYEADISANGELVELIHSLPSEKVISPVTIAGIKEAKNVRNRLLSRLQKTHYKWSIGARNDNMSEKFKTYISGGITPIPFQVDGKGYWFLPELRRLFDGFPTAALNEISINFTDPGLELSIKGTLYEIN